MSLNYSSNLILVSRPSDFDYKFHVSITFNKEIGHWTGTVPIKISDWLKENKFHWRWEYNNAPANLDFYFLNEQTALLFKLRWQ